MFEFLLWYFEVESQLGFKPDGKKALLLWHLNYSAVEAAREMRRGDAGKRLVDIGGKIGYY